jgi:hypothetical protein
LTPDPKGNGDLLERQFLGREYTYRVKLPNGQPLQAIADWRAKLEPGDRVRVEIASNRLRAFAIDDR